MNGKKKTFLIISVLCIVFSPLNAKALEPVVLTDGKEKYSLGLSMDIFEDTEGILTIDDLIKPENSGKFKRSTTDSPNYGYTAMVFWGRFSIINPQKDPREMYLEITYPLLDLIDLYVVDGHNRYSTKKGGDHFPFHEREVNHKSFVFKVNIRPGSNLFYVRIQSSSAIAFQIRLYTPTRFFESALTEYIFFGIYNGIIIVMVLYNLFIFLSIRDINYLYYILHISFYNLTMFILNGLAYQYLWPGNVWWGNTCVPFIVFIALMFLLQFSRSFLNLKKIAWAIDRIILIIMLMDFVGGVLSLFISYSLAIKAVNLCVVISCSSAYIGGFFSLLRGYRPARFYMIAWSLLLISIISHALQKIGLIPINDFSEYMFQIASALEVILLSLGLADRINIMRQEKEEAQADALRIQKEAIETLENKVRERTMELQESNEKLKDLDRVKSDFFSNVSHELKTPLTLILSPIESILNGDCGTTMDHESVIFKTMYNNGNRLLRLINNLLDFTKIESKKMSVKKKNVDAVRLLGHYISCMAPAAEKKKIHLDFFREPGAAIATLDTDLFEKAMYNLLSNALKFTPEGGKISIGLEQDAGSLLISVRDTGIGIPPDKLEAVFDRFVQADSSASRSYEGSGIGLSLAKEIVELHDGIIRVESEVGKGSNFIISLPCIVSPDPTPRGTDAGNPPGDEIPRTSVFLWEDRSYESELTLPCDEKEKGGDKLKTILIVEDNPDMLRFLCDLIGREYQVIQASNGKEGFEKLTGRKTPPDLVLSDVMMPVMDGYRLTRLIRSRPEFEGLPVILLTVKSDSSMKTRGFSKGASDYVTKPFNARELMARIKAQLDLKELRDRLISANRQLYRRLEKQYRNKNNGIGMEAEEKLTRVMEFIRENYDADISREGLAAAVSLSPDHLSRLFKRHTGKKIGDYINELRIQDAAKRLSDTRAEVITIAHESGFESLRTFNRVFFNIMKVTPTAYRSGERV